MEAHKHFGEDLEFVLAIQFWVGPLRLGFTWPSLTAVSTELADESFETNLKAEVTGTPPIIVTNVTPSDKPFRTEGGQPIEVTFFNGNERPIDNMRILIAPGTFAAHVPGSITPITLPDLSLIHI